MDGKSYEPESKVSGSSRQHETLLLSPAYSGFGYCRASDEYCANNAIPCKCLPTFQFIPRSTQSAFSLWNHLAVSFAELKPIWSDWPDGFGCEMVCVFLVANCMGFLLDSL